MATTPDLAQPSSAGSRLASAAAALVALLHGAALAGADATVASPTLPGISEIKLGAVYHDTPSLWSGFAVERPAVDGNAEILFQPLSWAFGGSIRPALGGTVNFNRQTSKAYADLRWERDTPSGVFFALGMGAAVHDGVLGLSDAGRKALGARVLFHPSAEVGYRFDGANSISIFFDHMSNGWTVRENEGFDTVGVRLGHRFGAGAAEALPPSAQAGADDQRWAGAYAGIFGGYLAATTDWTARTRATAQSRGGLGGGLGGGLLGYGWQSGAAVVGLEADWSALSASETTACLAGGGSCQSRIVALASVRPRFGWAFDRTLVYATGGLAIGSWDATIAGRRAVASAPTIWGETSFGVAVGAGLEHQLGGHLTLRSEVMHFGLAARDAGASGTSPMSVETRGIVGRAGLSYVFN